MSRAFDRFASRASEAAGHWLAFTLAVAFVVVWAASGPFLRWSDTWQLVANTATTIVTFGMIFLVQHTQNRDTKALHAKLDGLIAAAPAADDGLRGIERTEARP